VILDSGLSLDDPNRPLTLEKIAEELREGKLIDWQKLSSPTEPASDPDDAAQ
jgi:hypothetical protein